METYHALVAGTVVWMLASAGTADGRLPLLLAATLTVAMLLCSRALGRRRQKL